MATRYRAISSLIVSFSAELIVRSYIDIYVRRQGFHETVLGPAAKAIASDTRDTSETLAKV
eukprot:5424972-Amphidinium_carterae.1